HSETTIPFYILVGGTLQRMAGTTKARGGSPEIRGTKNAEEAGDRAVEGTGSPSGIRTGQTRGNDCNAGAGKGTETRSHCWPFRTASRHGNREGFGPGRRYDAGRTAIDNVVKHPRNAGSHQRRRIAPARVHTRAE